VIIFRYLVKEVYGTLLATTGVLLIIIISNQFIHYLSEAAMGVLPLRTVMQMMSLQVPLLLGLLLPLGLFLGILMAYGRLYIDHEMTVLSACGYSRGRLLGMTLLIATMVAVVVAVLMLWVKPKMEWYKRHILAEAAASSPLERILPDKFIALDQGKIILYAGDLSVNHQQLASVFIAQPPAHSGNPWAVMIASGGSQWVDPATRDKYIVFTNGNRYTGIPGRSDFQVLNYATYGYRIEKYTPPADARAEAMGTIDLWKNRHGHPKNHAELQWRISMPLSVFILTLLAVPLSQVKPRQGRYAQLLPAILLYVVYADLMFVAQAWLQKGEIASGIGMWWVHGVFLVLAILLLIRYLGWSQIKKSLGISRRGQYEFT
jgi:lipopolysaccharide export system permease protein